MIHLKFKGLSIILRFILLSYNWHSSKIQYKGNPAQDEPTEMYWLCFCQSIFLYMPLYL